jgi:hypothetical protein
MMHHLTFVSGGQHFSPSTTDCLRSTPIILPIHFCGNFARNVVPVIVASLVVGTLSKNSRFSRFVQ